MTALKLAIVFVCGVQEMRLVGRGNLSTMRARRGRGRKPQQTLRSSDASPPLGRQGLGRKACPLPQLFARSPSLPRRKQSCPSIDASSSASSLSRNPSSSSLFVKQYKYKYKYKYNKQT